MRTRLTQILGLIFPFLLWLYLFRSFLWGKAVVTAENVYIYSVLKLFLDNLSTGVFPLWNPYESWGSPLLIYISYIGIFNPVWLIILLAKFCGVDMYHAFVLAMTVYFFAGQIGFYLWAKTLLKNTLAAYTAFLLLLFSSAGLMIYQQYHPVLIFVPSVWFFFFLSRFGERQERYHFMGMIFSLMLIASSYMPLYFMTVCLLASVLFTAVSPSWIRNVWGIGAGFMRRHALLVLLGFLALGVSLYPGFTAYRSIVNQEVSSVSRQNEQALQGKNVSFDDYGAVQEGLSSRMEPRDLFSYLDELPYGHEGHIYLPVFIYLLLLGGAFIRNNKRITFLSLLAAALFVIVLTNATPVHRFLFRYVSYFRLIRNLHFFNSFLIAVLALLAGEELRVCLARRDFNPRPLWLAGVVAVHLGFVVFLSLQPGITVSTYASVLFSLGFWTHLILHHPKARPGILCALMVCGVLIQPLDVFFHYAQQGKNCSNPDLRQALKTPSRVPSFAFQRPLVSMETGHIQEQHLRLALCRIFLADSPGMMSGIQTDFPTRWAYWLSTKIPEEIYRPFTQFKFYLCTRVRVFPSGGEDVNAVAGALRHREDVAFVSQENDAAARKELQEFIRPGEDAGTGQAVVVPGPSERFSVESFTQNSMRILTDFPEDKFLIYTDSFHKDWQAFVNGRRVPLYRADLAFKGLKIPAGENRIDLRFHPRGGTTVWFLILFVFYGTLGSIGVLYFMRPDRRTTKIKDR